MGNEKKAMYSPREMRTVLRLVICGSIFILLVTVKLILPEKMSAINGALVQMLEQNIDVREVFSAVGHSFAGEGGSEELYQAVFHPADAVDAGWQDTSRENTAMEELHRYQKNNSGTEPADEEKQVTAMALIQYTDQNLPENVKLQQDILGFEFCTPVTGMLTSGFGYRKHPTKKEERFHYGVDLAAEDGTPICCFANGTVTTVGESNSYGKYCIVTHEGGYETLYAHCSRITASSGKTVGKGEKIAEVGKTGVATGSHLHFELHKDGVYLNPIYYVAH